MQTGISLFSLPVFNGENTSSGKETQHCLALAAAAENNSKSRFNFSASYIMAAPEESENMKAAMKMLKSKKERNDENIMPSQEMAEEENL